MLLAVRLNEILEWITQLLFVLVLSEKISFVQFGQTSFHILKGHPFFVLS